ncbi:hypothetical protein Sjap_006207 [Stephania japonica]|uniref:DUF4378 domain-containing protein n=1 Tax=Stephania japonica TaxID=461633 RepID=A0AAP0PKU4_9MAGN
MSGVKNKRDQNFEKQIPGCMGRMVNLFDFGPGVSGNRLLSDKAHRDGFLPSGNQEDLDRKVFAPNEDQTADVRRGYELRRSSKKSGGTPMKMLIAREMSTKTESKQKPPNVVAKLMGLDVLPGQQHNLTSQRSCSKVYSQNVLSPSHRAVKCCPQESGFEDKQMQFESHNFQDQEEYEDAYKSWDQSPNKNNYRENSLQIGKHKEQQSETKMDLVRQKFIQAKRLATDEKLRQSKEFQDALEVLSANKDLFLKFLQEPNSLFSQHLYELQSIPPSPQTNRITVLRPSKTTENVHYVGHERKGDKHMQKQSELVETHGWDKCRPSLNPLFTNQKDNTSSQPTRIVVLKPSPGKSHDIKTVGSSPTVSPRLHDNDDLYEELDDEEARSSREVAKEITRQMRESLGSNRREETVLSSVFSNGYVGDDSSFNRSENEYTGEGHLSDLDVMTPTSRHSWNYVHRFGSPVSSSFSRASYSPESSVCREAKKRLSERWALMSLNCSNQEQRQVRRSSSTLGEMLALFDAKKSCEGIQGAVGVSSRSCGGEQDLQEPTSHLPSGREKDEDGVNSPKNLLRSRSVPVSSAAYGSRLNIEIPDSQPEISRSDNPKELVKSKSAKSSFKGKVSSLFFSRNKKLNKEQPKASADFSLIDKHKCAVVETPGTAVKHSAGEMITKSPQSVPNNIPEGTQSPVLGRSFNKSSPFASDHLELKNGTFSHEALFSVGEPKMHESKESQDQPSPISVLDASFEDESSTPQFDETTNTDLQGSAACLKSNLIAKSPPIGSLARSLSYDEACLDTVISDPLNSASVSPEAEEREWLSFVQSLLSSVGLDSSDVSDAAFINWNSLETPLSPLLLDKFVNPKEDRELRHEAKRRQRRSNQKLIFDCVNAALVDIIGHGSNATPWTRFSSQGRISSSASVTVEEVWSRVKEWLSSQPKYSASESRDYSLFVESTVKQEVVGGRWAELLRTEVDGLGTDIESKMLDELVEEALFELTGCFC